MFQVMIIAEVNTSMYLPRAIGFIFAATVLLLHMWCGFVLDHDLFYPQFLARGLFVSFIGGIAGYGLGVNIIAEYFKLLEKQLTLDFDDAEPILKEIPEIDLTQDNLVNVANAET